jgi:1-phosphofructokinase
LARVTIFGPHPLLTITIERRDQQRDDIHIHAGGQGVWVSRMVGELGAEPVLCGFIGGETGTTLEPLLERLPGERRLIRTVTRSGCYVHDRRSGEREHVSAAWSEPPSRHELDDLFSVTTASAVDSDVLVLCNPAPAETLPLEVYANLVSDVRSNGTPVLAEYVYGPVSEPAQMRAAAERIRDAGAKLVVVTRAGDPAFVLDGEDAYELIPPRFERGSREGCGDSMMGGVGAAWAKGLSWQDALVHGAAAGAANFLRHGLGTGSRDVIEELLPRVELRRIS